MSYTLQSERAQTSISAEPYDSWKSPGGNAVGHFYRTDSGFLVRFPDKADFEIDARSLAVTAHPLPGTDRDLLDSLYYNAILPLLGNHAGHLHLHGSAVAVGDVALAFMGLSRRGKTTLAGAFAREGHAFLAEDAVALVPGPAGYAVQPQRPVLRVFGDSADFLTGGPGIAQAPEGKVEIAARGGLRFAGNARDLRAICILGPGTATELTIAEVGPVAALAELMQHAFILDIKDAERLKGHFQRMSDLVISVPCYAVDYPRRFAELPGVVAGLAREFGQGRA